MIYEVYGEGEPTVLLMPTWSIIHSRHWKMQIPYLARNCRVLTFDGRGNGRSDRPAPSPARDPVKVNLLLRDFVKPAPPPGRGVRGKSRRKRALHISSPIGLGHAQRDVAIAAELRKLHPDLEIDWLAQHPVTTVLQAHGERMHPASGEHYSFAGYVTGFDPSEFADRVALRHELGYRDDEQVRIVTVGGSGVGEHLLRRVVEAFPEAKRRVPALRMVVVTGPRIDPGVLPQHEGLELRAYVHELYRHLAACDLAVVQGGLTTCMELTANRRPFLYFPLAHHFEQNFSRRPPPRPPRGGPADGLLQRRPRRDRCRHRRRNRPHRDYQPVAADGAARAASLIAQLV